METLKLIGWVIVFFIAMIPLYWVAKRNTDYKRNQRYGMPRYNDGNQRTERK